MVTYHYQELDWQMDWEEDTADWLKLVALGHGYELGELQVVFTTDAALHQLNIEILNHDWLTDIITLDHSPKGSKLLFGDLYISIDRVRENANTYKQRFIDELHRVLVHGLLHLMGHEDDTEEAKQAMRQQETLALNMRLH